MHHGHYQKPLQHQPAMDQPYHQPQNSQPRRDIYQGLFTPMPSPADEVLVARDIYAPGGTEKSEDGSGESALDPFPLLNSPWAPNPYTCSTSGYDAGPQHCPPEAPPSSGYSSQPRYSPPQPPPQEISSTWVQNPMRVDFITHPSQSSKDEEAVHTQPNCSYTQQHTGTWPQAPLVPEPQYYTYPAHSNKTNEQRQQPPRHHSRPQYVKTHQTREDVVRAPEGQWGQQRQDYAWPPSDTHGQALYNMGWAPPPDNSRPWRLPPIATML
ncbi:hypothetical protein C8034_v005294 [Colletotrichum sidae]|uniref:Uncharacterized protein n=1 Tax=Colletotrichum sidae TaxID=1347389 RepID=A0A4R8T6V2_9PEZI|nr:hypothetical protein C8034_v005294 [Colletotrichum sidae]